MNNHKKNLVFLISVTIAVSATFSACANTADTTNQVNQVRQERKMPENMITGKITAIDSNSVTIEVAVRKEMEKKENGEMGNPPERPEEWQGKQDGTMQHEKPNEDSMFTLTGEIKIINIASADFGKNMPRFDRDSMKEKSKEEMKKEMEEAMQSATAKTYQDYKVGDYISIEATDNTYAIAKRVSNAMGGGRMGGFRGHDKNRKDNMNEINN